MTKSKEYIGTPSVGDKLLDPLCLKCSHPVDDHIIHGDEYDAYYSSCSRCDCYNCTAKIEL